MSDDRQGVLVGERYRIEAPIATGGMGTIHAARDETTGRHVVVKLLREELGESDEAVERFRREVTAAASISAPQIVKVYDAGRLNDGTPYMVMERLEGRDLDQVIESGGLERNVLLELLLELAIGLAHAHAAGVVHRDLKPSNVFITNDLRVKVLDFGIAKIFDTDKISGSDDEKLTHTQAVLGSPAYMSPEQLASSKDVDGRADLWSFGVLFYEALSGVQLFSGESMGAVFTQVITKDIPPLSSLVPGADARLDAIASRCLDRDPSMRYPTAAALVDDLAPLVRRAAPELPAPSGPAVPAERWDVELEPGEGKRQPVWVLLFVLIGLGAVTLIWFTVQAWDRTPSASVPASAPSPAACASVAAESPPPDPPAPTPTPSPTASPEPSPPLPVEPRPKTNVAKPKPATAPPPVVPSSSPPKDDLWESSRQ